jgi:acyl-coenzyme A thioesterase PaaI-like protein
VLPGRWVVVIFGVHLCGVDGTDLARLLLGPVPAHRSAGLEVVRAVDGVGVVAVVVRPAATNVIGSLHSSGLITLIDAAGLAAIIGACPSEDAFANVVPLGAEGRLRFLAPGLGRLVATCTLGAAAREQLDALFGGARDRARITTAATIADSSGAVVCDGEFDWSIRRLPG